MRSYYALFKSNMQLTMRDRSVLFFNYMFPLIFFFAFAEMFHAGTGQGIAYFVGTVLTMGILGNGLWGAGMRSVQDREANILRRYKVTPITPLPIPIGSVCRGRGAAHGNPGQRPVGRGDAQRAGPRGQHPAALQSDADYSAAHSGGLHGKRMPAVPAGAGAAGGAGALSLRHADAAELVLAFPDGIHRGVQLPRAGADSGSRGQHHGGGQHPHPGALHADRKS